MYKSSKNQKPCSHGLTIFILSAAMFIISINSFMQGSKIRSMNKDIEVQKEDISSLKDKWVWKEWHEINGGWIVKDSVSVDAKTIRERIESLEDYLKVKWVEDHSTNVPAHFEEIGKDKGGYSVLH